MKTAEVVVAGAGPTGLMLANELALAGVDVVVLDRLAARTGLSKALNLQPRTAEVLDLRGLLERAERRSFTTVGEGHFATIPVGYTGWDTRHPYQLGIPQAEVEALLEERLAEQGVEVLRSHELTSFTQDGSGVTVNAGEETLRASYLVGCDGGRSAVRKALDVSFSWIDGRGFGVVADVLFAKTPPGAPRAWRSMRDIAQGHGGATFSGLIPLGEPNLFRLVYGDRAHRPANLRSEVDPTEVLAALRTKYGEDLEVAEIRWASRFSDDSRLASRYREGRVLLAGDAAHIHFPAGGQGLNLGIQDAMNLGWKLAAELRGRAPEGLLDTYESERRPVAARVLENVAAQTGLAPVTPEQKALRALFTDLCALPEVQHHLSGMISGLDIAYGPEGVRMPDFKTPTGWASSLFHEGTHVLLTTKPQPAPPHTTVAVVPELPWPNVESALVRPDGYVAGTKDS